MDERSNEKQVTIDDTLQVIGTILSLSNLGDEHLNNWIKIVAKVKE